MLKIIRKKERFEILLFLHQGEGYTELIGGDGGGRRFIKSWDCYSEPRWYQRSVSKAVVLAAQAMDRAITVQGVDETILTLHDQFDYLESQTQKPPGWACHSPPDWACHSFLMWYNGIKFAERAGTRDPVSPESKTWTLVDYVIYWWEHVPKKRTDHS